MLAVDNLHLRIGKHDILNGLSCRIPDAGLLVIIGPNGCGKSSLLRCLSGWNRPSQGAVKIDGEHVHQLSAKRRAACISSLPQRPTLSESVPILDMIASARYRFSESPKKSRQVASALLEESHLSHLKDRDWSGLSGGEAQRVALTCMRAQEAKTWLLDEPANHLDPAIQREMYQDLISEWQAGRTLVIVTHNINLVVGALSPADYPKVSVLGLENGTASFEALLSDADLDQKIGRLYTLSCQRLTAFERDHFVFGTPA